MSRRNIIWSFLSIVLLVGCGVDREAEVESLKENLSSYDELRIYLEKKYETRLSDSSRPRLVFKRCEEFEKSTRDFVCSDLEVLEKMEALSIKDVSFEKKECDIYAFSEVYFQVSEAGEYPVIYYLFERCGTGDPFESRNIYYEPVNDKWGLYIDSSFP